MRRAAVAVTVAGVIALAGCGAPSGDPEPDSADDAAVEEPATPSASSP